MTDDFALFDLQAPRRPTGPSRVERGQTGGTYERTVIAHVEIGDAAALCKAAVQAIDSEPAFEITSPTEKRDPRWDDEHGWYDEDNELEVDERAKASSDPDFALLWLLDPFRSHMPLTEVDAADVWSARSGVESSDRGWRLRWTVRLRVRDLSAFRRLAVENSPEADPAAIADSLTVAWQHAVDPYAPLHDIPFISWTPVEVKVKHLPAKERWRSDR